MDLIFREREQMFANAEINKKPEIDLENKNISNKRVTQVWH